MTTVAQNSQTHRLPVANARAVVAEVSLLARGHRRSIAIACVLLLGASGLGLVFPLTIGWIVETISARRDGELPSVFWEQLVLLGGAVILAGVLEFAGMLRLTHVAEAMIAGLRERYVKKALDLPPDVVETAGIGDVVSRSSSDVREISDIVPWVLPNLVAAVFTLALSFGGMTLIDWRFAIGLLAALPLYGLALRWYVRTAPAVYAAQRAAESERSQRVLTTIQAMPTVTAYRMGTTRRQVVRDATWQMVRWAMRAKIQQNRLFGRSTTAEGVGLLLIVGLGFALAASGDAGVGDITAATLLYFRVVAPVDTLLFVMDDFQLAMASLARVVGVSGKAPGPAEPATEEPVRPARPGPAQPVLQAFDVHHEYRAGHPVLDGVTLSVAEGEHVAVVGESGSGKTTLARLLAGTSTPVRGRIERGVDLTQIAYLTQEHHVFEGTLADNLGLARPSATAEELTVAWEEVSAASVTQHFPEGVETVLGEHGLRVSASVAQQIALARLVLSDASVAILDEATAEAESQDSLTLEAATQRVLKGRAAIVIAHRLDQAVACDRIIVLDGGRIAEEGTHEQLATASGRYAVLWAAWSAATAR